MIADMTLPHYILIYDEEIDAICSLELLVECIPKVITIPHHLKWVILSLHNSLQGFMVLALQGTNALNVLKKQSAKNRYDGCNKVQHSYKPRELDNFMRLYAKIKSDTMMLQTNSKPFVPNSTQDESVAKLNSFRNDFVHYVPAGSAFDMRAKAKVVLDVLPIIEFLAFESNNIFFPKEGRHEQVAGLCVMAKDETSALLKHYSA